MATEFTLIRHGQTTANLAGTLQGQLETELDAVGVRQAHAAAAFLRGKRFDHIFTSDLKRAADTAVILGAALSAPVTQTAFLREWDLGDLQGMALADAAARYPEVQKAFHFPMTDCVVPGGESLKEFSGRIARGMEELARRHDGEKLLLVTHAGVLRNVFLLVAGNNPHAMLPATNNASCCRLLWKEGFWRLCSWNETAYLDGIGSLNSTAL